MSHIKKKKYHFIKEPFGLPFELTEKNKFKVGDKVLIKDGDPNIYYVYGIYSPTKVSLGLKDYPDVEQDWQISTSKLKKVNK